MATYDARPSSFTQLTTTGEWEYFCSAAGLISAIADVHCFCWRYTRRLTPADGDAGAVIADGGGAGAIGRGQLSGDAMRQ